jgi:hypothetical protein
MTIETVGARDWRLKDQRYSLRGDNCPHCEEKHFPPRDVCSGCGGTKDEDTNIPDSFKITTPGYGGTFRLKYATQEVQPYSKMLYPDVDVEENTEIQIGESNQPIKVKMEPILIYQAEEIPV